MIDLYNQALLLSVSFLTFTILVYSFFKNEYFSSMRLNNRLFSWPWKHIGIVVVISIVLSAIPRFVIQTYFTEDSIPYEMIGWVMPLGVAIVLIIYNIKSKTGIIRGASGILSATILMLLLANNYYYYFPTISAIFEKQHPATTIKSDLVVSKLVREDFFLPPKTQPGTGVIQPLDIPATGTFSPRGGFIYLPPAMSNNDLITLPVVVLLPGYPGNPSDWENDGLLSIMNDFASRHKGLAPIVAVVDPLGKNEVDTECVDSKLGAVETYLAKDVPNYLKAHYQVSMLARDWTIAGDSAGGTCSALVALRNPSVYQNFMNISGDTYPSLGAPANTLATLFGGSQANQDAHTPNLLLQKGNPLYKTMNAWYFVGQQDNPKLNKRIQEQVALASKAGITTNESSTNGHHDFRVFKAGFVEGLPWIMNQIRFTAP